MGGLSVTMSSTGNCFYFCLVEHADLKISQKPHNKIAILKRFDNAMVANFADFIVVCNLSQRPLLTTLIQRKRQYKQVVEVLKIRCALYKLKIIYWF